MPHLDAEFIKGNSKQTSKYSNTRKMQAVRHERCWNHSGLTISKAITEEQAHQRTFRVYWQTWTSMDHDAKPTILVGLEHLHLLITTDRRHADENSPIAVRAKLGWLNFGKICKEDDYFSLSITEEKK